MNRLIKRVVSWVLLFVTVVCLFDVNNIEIDADSNTLRETYIQLMSGAGAAEIDDIENLTVNDLRVIALWLSNFYVPFNTSLDDEENKEQSTKLMVEALKLLHMKPDVAEVLVNSVYQASYGSVKQLYISSKDVERVFGAEWEKPMFFRTGSAKQIDQEELAEVQTGIVDSVLNSAKDGLTHIASFMTGGASEAIINRLKELSYVGVDAQACATNTIYSNAMGQASGEYFPISIFQFLNLCARDFQACDDGEAGVKLYYQGDSGFVPCFEVTNDVKNLLASMIKMVDPSDHKVGNAIVNCDYSEWLSMGDDLKPAVTCFTQRMFVDWVGNIIVDFGDTRVIAIPACINPYVFGKVSDTGAVARVNLVSTWGAKCMHTDYKMVDGVYKSNGITLNMDLGALRGSAGGNSQLFDSTLGWGRGDGGKVADFLNKMGVFTGWWIGGNPISDMNWTTNSNEIAADYAMTEYLVYKSVANVNLDSGSVFERVNFYPSGIDSYFEKASTFNKKSDDFTSFMQFDTQDLIMMRNYFITYAFAYHNRLSTTYDESKNYLDMKFNDKNFPSSIDTSIVWDTVNSDSEKITSFIYYLLHPVEGVRYVATWFKNKVAGILISFHEDIVGSTDSNSTTGMTRYLGFTGYVTSPSLEEVSWVHKLMDRYDSLIVYLIMMMMVILLCYVLTGYMSLQRSVIGIIFFAFLAFLPPVAISTVTTTINTICDTIYSDKFDYWSYTQMQTYLVKLSNVKAANTVNDYVSALMEFESSGIQASTGFSGVKVKWMSPKKIRDVRANDELKESLEQDFSTTMISLLSNTVADTGVEAYVEGISATYLYRDFFDIYRYGASSYNLYSTYNFNGALDSELKDYGVGTKITESSKGIRRWAREDGLRTLQYPHSSTDGVDPAYYKDYLLANVELKELKSQNKDYILQTSSLNAIRKGFLNDTVKMSDDTTEVNYYTKDGALATTFLNTYNDIPAQLLEKRARLEKDLSSKKFEVKVAKMSSDAFYYGLSPRVFDYSLNDLEEKGVSEEAVSSDVPSGEEISAFYYALYAESPYYFFDYNFRDVMTHDTGNYAYKNNSLDSSTKNVYKVFTKDDQAFFYNLSDNAGDGYGELKDFMNFHDLFYYVMPVLNIGNEITDGFDRSFGMYVNDDLSLKITPEGKVKYNGVVYDDLAAMEKAKDSDGKNVFEQMTEEELYKFWHDYNVWTIFQGYVPWLDTMQDCKYAKPEAITVLGEKYNVENPLDPTSYFKSVNGTIVEGRYMVFSRSEMEYYGLDMTDLTTVEQKIIKVQDNVYRKTLDLMNYYTLADEVLMNAYSMIQVFEFNKEFSQSSLFGSSYIMYPQGYEAKAFSYDAYLRLVVAEASGEPIQTSDGDSIYRRVISKTSLFFGFFLLINDVLSVYIIPCLKVAFLIMLFFVSVLLIVAASIKMELNLISTFWKSILQPLFSYFAISVGFAWLVSLFMSNGAYGVTEVSSTISIGDPTTVIIIMIVINVSVMILYFKVAWKCFKDLKLYFKSVIDNVASTVVGALQRMGATVANGRRNKAYRALNKMANGVPSSARQRGRENTGVGAAFGGAALGAGAVLAAKSQGGDGAGGYGGGNGHAKSVDDYDRKAGLSARAADTDARLADSKSADKKRNEAKDYNSVESRGKRGLESANNKLETASEYKQAFKNGQGMSFGERAKLGVGVVKYGVQGKAQQLKNTAQVKAAQGVKGVGRRIDNATGNRIGSLIHGNGVSAETAVLQTRRDRISGEQIADNTRRANKFADFKRDASQRDQIRMIQDKGYKIAYHALKKGSAGGKQARMQSIERAKNVVRDANASASRKNLEGMGFIFTS